MVCFAREVVRRQLSLSVFILLLVLSPRLHALVRAAHPLAMCLHFLHDLLSLLFLLHLTASPHPHSFLVASLIQIVVLLRLALTLLVLSKHTHDFFFDRNVDLREIIESTTTFGNASGFIPFSMSRSWFLITLFLAPLIR